MAKTGKIKKISISHIDEVIKENYNNVVIKDWFGADLVITKTIDVVSMASFVGGVFASCIDEGRYLPEAYDFAIRKSVIDYHSNVSLPSDTAKQYYILEVSGLYEEIMKEINMNQHNEIINAINKKIEEAIGAFTLESQHKIEEYGIAIRNVIESLSGIFDGITDEDIKKIASSVSENGIDEEKIVKAFLKYNNKDVTVDAGKSDT